MNLLPKSSKEFGSADYWEKFFQQRGKTAFEWYGTYLELCEVLHKYIKPKEKVWRAASPLWGLKIAILSLGGRRQAGVGTPLRSIILGFCPASWLSGNLKDSHLKVKIFS
jgi:hypothetical protein